jgi:hypothetical protein
MSESERERAALIEALGQISMFCDFRPATTTMEQVEHLLAAIPRDENFQANNDLAIEFLVCISVGKHRGSWVRPSLD